MSSVDTGISDARHAQKSRARSSSTSARITGARNMVSNETHSRRRKFISDFAPVLGGRLRRPQRIIERLIVVQRLGLHAPAIIVAAKSDCRPVAHSAVVQRTSHIVDSNPMPKKFDIAKVAGFADSSNVQDLPARN